MKSDAKLGAKQTPVPKLKPNLTDKPHYGGVLRTANTYVLPPRMGVPGKITLEAFM